ARAGASAAAVGPRRPGRRRSGGRRAASGAHRASRSSRPHELYSPNQDQRRSALRLPRGRRDTARREVRPVAHCEALWAWTPARASSCGRSGPLFVYVGGAGLTRAVERRARQALPDFHHAGSPVSALAPFALEMGLGALLLIVFVAGLIPRGEDRCTRRWGG